MLCTKFQDSPSRKYHVLSFFEMTMLSDVLAKPALEPFMADRKSRRPAPMKSRKDFGEVVFPIEKLKAARAANASCVHIEADLEADTGLIKPSKNRSRSSFRGLEPK